MAALPPVLRQNPPLLLTQVIEGQGDLGRCYQFIVDGTLTNTSISSVQTGILRTQTGSLGRTILKVVKATDVHKTKYTEGVWLRTFGRREERMIGYFQNVENIVKLKAGFKSGSYSYALALEHLPCELHDKVLQKPLSLLETARCGKDILHALIPIHQNKRIYGDLKPANVCLTESGVYKLIDFEGLTKIGTQDNPHRTTWDCVAPETLYRVCFDTSYDIYGLGYVLVFCCTQGQLFRYDGEEPICHETLKADLAYHYFDLIGVPPSYYCKGKHFQQLFVYDEKLNQYVFRRSRSENLIKMTMPMVQSHLRKAALRTKDPVLQALELKRADLLFDLLKKIYVYERRITAKEALAHPFFAEIAKEEEKKDKV